MMLLNIPAGNFLMGSSDADISNYLKLFSGSLRSWFTDEQPQHTVYLDAFWIDQTDVTNAQYAKCVAAKFCRAPANISSGRRNAYYGNSGFADYPMVNVDWNMAKAYCEWAGRKLPTEAEWEKAARGTDGRIFPWGSEVDCNKANYRDCVGDTSRVGSYPAGASPYGALDMAGNVSEWVADWYDSAYYWFNNAYSGIRTSSNPTGPDYGQSKVLRGGNWDYFSDGMRTASRADNDPTFAESDIGFRCAVSQP